MPTGPRRHRIYLPDAPATCFLATPQPNGSLLGCSCTAAAIFVRQLHCRGCFFRREAPESARPWRYRVVSPDNHRGKLKPMIYRNSLQNAGHHDGLFPAKRVQECRSLARTDSVAERLGERLPLVRTELVRQHHELPGMAH